MICSTRTSSRYAYDPTDRRGAGKIRAPFLRRNDGGSGRESRMRANLVGRLEPGAGLFWCSRRKSVPLSCCIISFVARALGRLAGGLVSAAQNAHAAAVIARDPRPGIMLTHTGPGHVRNGCFILHPGGRYRRFSPDAVGIGERGGRGGVDRLFGTRPRRTIRVVFFTGEQGLLGSKAWVRTFGH